MYVVAVIAIVGPFHHYMDVRAGRPNGGDVTPSFRESTTSSGWVFILLLTGPCGGAILDSFVAPAKCQMS